jgi:hypothetical protein
MTNLSGQQLMRKLNAADGLGGVPLGAIFHDTGAPIPVDEEEEQFLEARETIREIRVEEFDDINAWDGAPRIYRVTLVCLQELNCPTLQRIISLGQSAAAAQDDAE